MGRGRTQEDGVALKYTFRESPCDFSRVAATMSETYKRTNIYISLFEIKIQPQTVILLFFCEIKLIQLQICGKINY